VSATRAYEEELLGELLSRLPPAPGGWVRAAQELPAAGRALGAILELARSDAGFRVRLSADLEPALAAAGFEPTEAIVDAVRACLPDLDR
jgi:hypothetical protein